MKKLILAVLLLLLPVVAQAAPSLTWDPVTTGTDGSPLGAGLEVTSYKVYQCGPGMGNCSKNTGLLVGTIIAPAVSFDLAGQPTPVTYVVTAVNKVAESADSLPFKVVPPDVPKNVHLP